MSLENQLMQQTGMLFCGLLSMSISVLGSIADCDGIVNGNFSIGANVSLDGKIFGQIIYNPARLGAQLEPAGFGQFRFNVGDVTLYDIEFENKEIDRKWPFALVKLSDPRMACLTFSFETFAPVVIENLFATSLPAVMADVTVSNGSELAQTIKLAMVAEKLLTHDPKSYIATPVVHGARGRVGFTGWAMPSSGIGKDNMGWVEVTVGPKSKEKLRFVYTRYDEEGMAASKFDNPISIAEYVVENWDSLKSATKAFDAAIPETGNAKVDGYARWYLSCGPLMTKIRKDGIVVNMGYSELNQRDSFWTSWIHLVFWPEADRKMIEESAEFQREDGKIPTTVLPLIERNDDIDITTYYIHRINRYSRFHNDLDFAKKMFPSLLKAFDFLYSMDDEGVGVPMQHSFWGDWKDVGGMEDRKYSPYSTMLFVAALRDSTELADMIGEKEAARDLKKKYKRAKAFLNNPADKGGMFNGRFFRQIWKDPQKGQDQVMQDQVVGIIFDVVDGNKADSILKALDNNMTEYGPAETYPYFPDGFGYDAGEYHNGGAWPYLTFVHAWALMQRGQTDKSYDIIKKMGYADLEKDGDWLPHEFVGTLSGKNGGPKIQGWNASIFAPLYFQVAGHKMDNIKK